MSEISEHSLGIINQIVLDEFRKASGEFKKFNSGHEGFAVLKEEVDELWEAVKLNKSKYPERDDLMQKEAIQVAAMAFRFLHDISFEGTEEIQEPDQPIPIKGCTEGKFSFDSDCPCGLEGKCPCEIAESEEQCRADPASLS